MRTDEHGEPCPATLGEYRDVCERIAMGRPNEAVAFLDQLIAANPQGRDEPVLTPDSQMRHLLYPLLLPNCDCRTPGCGHKASQHDGPGGACVVPGCTCGPGGWS